MGQIVGDPGHPHAEKHLPAAVDGKVLQIHQRAEDQSVDSGNNSPDQRRVVFTQQHGDHDENGPDIQIPDPPDVKPEDQAFKQHVDIHGVQGFPAEEDDGQDDQDRIDVDVGQACQRDLCGKDQSRHQGKDAELFGGELTIPL